MYDHVQASTCFSKLLTRTLHFLGICKACVIIHVTAGRGIDDDVPEEGKERDAATPTQLGKWGRECDVSPPSRGVRSVRGSPAPASPFWQPPLTRGLFLAAGCDRIGLIAPATAVCPNASSAFCPEQEHFRSRDHGGTHTPARVLARRTCGLKPQFAPRRRRPAVAVKSTVVATHSRSAGVSIEAIFRSLFNLN
ncbi:conserved hypothetical protein [Coccidioides posadasii str. Silveira]|uniref:Uncharacterized protein n=1 Tax=Coccidioides posadasii (strain RMSCC 757 / Silveira) TaxID=443226 RepID=E9DI38_COCPS|nr:conserved hypothetical protein [Coccidioides posadasii str. Silveira]